MNSYEMVLGIIIVVTIGSILRARYGAGKGKWSSEARAEPALEAENARLRDELRSIKERVQVLERVITDTNRSAELDREIERLRDTSV